MPASPTWPGLIGDLLGGRDLTIAESTWAMQQVMDGLAPSAALAGFLVALRAKGETVDEIVGFRDAVLARAVPLPVDPAALDIVGTGGDGFRTVNVSTTAAVVAAAAGVPVGKHGNRAASSPPGATDLLPALRVRLDLPAEHVARVLESTGI